MNKNSQNIDQKIKLETEIIVNQQAITSASASTSLAASANSNINENVNVDVNVNNAMKPAAFKAINIFNAATIQRYKELRAERKIKEEKKKTQNRELSEHSTQLELTSIKEQVEKFPEKYPRFIEYLKINKITEIEKFVKPRHIQTINSGLLEHALFSAITSTDVDLLEELIKLGVDTQSICRELYIPRFPSAIHGGLHFEYSSLYYCLVSHPLFDTEDKSVGFSKKNAIADSEYRVNCKWTELESLKRAQMIQALIWAGSSVDNPQVLGSGYQRTFLNLLIFRSLRYGSLRHVLLDILHNAKACGLNLNILNNSNQNLLIAMLVDISRAQVHAMEGFEDIQFESVKEIIQALTEAHQFDYSHYSQGYYNTCVLFEELILAATKKCEKGKQDKTLLALMKDGVIFRDMAKQALDHIRDSDDRVYCNIEKYLIEHAKAYYLEESSSFEQYARDRFPNDEDMNASGRAELAIKDLIVAPAMQILKAQYSLGFAMDHIQHYLPVHLSRSISIKNITGSLWGIVLNYCYDNLTWVFDAYRRSKHIQISCSTQSDGLYSIMQSTQVVPFELLGFAQDFIESDSHFTCHTLNNESWVKKIGKDEYAFGPWNTENATINSHVSDSISITQTQQAESISKLPRYYQYCFRPFVLLGTKDINHCQIIVQASMIPGKTVIRFLENGQPVSAFLCLSNRQRKIDHEIGENSYKNYDQFKLLKCRSKYEDSYDAKEVRQSIKYFEELKRELANEEIIKKNATGTKNVAVKTAANAPVLLSQSAQTANGSATGRVENGHTASLVSTAASARATAK